jgi:hypothetical protein
MKRRSIALAVLLGTAGLGVLAAAAPAASAAPASCLVVDTNSNQSYNSLQGALTAAAPDDALIVKGTCTGSAVIGENLTITGQSNRGHATGTLNGGGVRPVLLIESGAVVTINTLIITGGTAHGGITSLNSTVTLNNSTVTGNTDQTGENSGGIRNSGGTLTLNDSTIAGNKSRFGTAGGILNNGGGTVTLNRSTVTGNYAQTSGGGILNGGTVTLNGSSITGNTAHTYSGGGILNLGTVTLNGSSSITGNTVGAAGDGGGIYMPNAGGTVTLNGSSSITGNKPDNCVPAGSVTGCTG